MPADTNDNVAMKKRLALAIASLISLSGCAHLNTQPAAEPVSNVTSAPEAPAKPFPKDTLYELLLAEMAGQQNRADIALTTYARQAFSTNDPAVLARATQISQFVNAQPLSLELSERWLSTEPNSSEAAYAVVSNALRNQRFDQAISTLQRLLKNEPDADFESLFIASIPNSAEGRHALLDALDTLTPSEQHTPDILFARALILERDGQFNSAIKFASEAIKLRPSSVPAHLLKTRLFTELKQDKAAIDYLGTAVKSLPNSRSLRINYARLLIRTKNTKAAEAQFDELIKQNSKDSDVLLTRALLALESKDFKTAEPHLQSLLTLGAHSNEAHYYLGVLARQQNQWDKALQEFAAVEPSNFFLSAQLESVEILRQQGKVSEARSALNSARVRLPDAAPQLYALEADMLIKNQQAPEALKLLNHALTKHPHDEMLVYSRSMAAEKLDDLVLFERDMRTLLSINPDNPTVLNALGYTLANRTNRFDEAEVLVAKALALRPTEPAIMDSMGWVHFKKGQLNEAYALLKKAYELFPDDEVAAHLGEVLWAMGRKDEAIAIWDAAQAKTPDSQHVLETRKRLAP